MSLNSTQSPIQILDVMQHAFKKGQDLRVSKSGVVRSATLWDKAKSSIQNIFGYAESAKHWEEKAKNQLIEKMKNDTILFAGKLTEKEDELITNLTKNIKEKLTENRRSWKEILDAELKIIENGEHKKIATALQQVKTIGSVQKKDLYTLARHTVETKKLGVLEALEVAAIAKKIKKEFGLPKDVALNSAYVMHKFMASYHVEKSVALKLVILAGKILKKERSEKNDPRDITKKTMELAWHAYSARNHFGLNEEESILVAEATVQIMETDKKTAEQALKIAHCRLLKMKEMRQTTPHGIALSLVEGAFTEYKVPLSKKGEAVFMNFLSLETNNKKSEDGTSAQFAVDISRSKNKIVIGKTTHTYSGLASDIFLKAAVKSFDEEPENAKATKDDLTKKITETIKKSTVDATLFFCDNDPDILFSLSLVANQSSGNGLLLAAFKDLAPPKNSLFFMDANGSEYCEESKYNEQEFYLTWSRTPEGNFIIESHVSKNYFTLKNSDSGIEFPINRKGGDYGLELISKVEYLKEDFKKNIIKPRVIETEVIVRIAPAWSEIIPVEEDQAK